MKFAKAKGAKYQVGHRLYLACVSSWDVDVVAAQDEHQSNTPTGLHLQAGLKNAQKKRNSKLVI